MTTKNDRQIVVAEHAPAKEAFLDYCMLGSTRNLLKLASFYKEKSKTGQPVPTKSHMLLKTWSAKFDWTKRVEKWDDEQLAEKERKWKDRQDQLREQNWEMGNKLRDLANQMLETAPKFIKQKRQFIPGINGNPDREIITLGLREDVLIRLAEVASALQTQAAGTERTTTIERSEGGGIMVKAFDYNNAIDVLKPDDAETIAVQAAVKSLAAGDIPNSSDSDEDDDAAQDS
jgi:hypothetical protein